jgi:CRISPR/Cas system-associated protein Cas10 (large subunit of type III CRISPR-Cas system)
MLRKAEAEGRIVQTAPRDRTHCPAGHEYTPGNTGRTSTGWRYCSTCNRERAIEGHHRRMEQQGRKVAVAPKDRTHCPHGHPYEGENLIRKKDGSRACRECKRLRRSK